MVNETVQNQSMHGKTCLVTGATSGIGKVTAKALAELGGEVIIAGRDRRKVEDIIEWIKIDTGNKSIHPAVADFTNLHEIHDLAQSVKDRFSRLDVLVNNAGAFFNTRQETAYGVEKTFLVNHLAPFLLTNLLMDVLNTGTQARIVNISSEAHRYGSIDFDDLQYKRGYAGMKAYARSKLANIYFTYELARRLHGSSITANAVHPGHVATNMWKSNFPVIGPVLKWVMGFLAISPQEGADTSIYVVTSPELEGVTGKYFDKRMAVLSSPESYDEGIALRLWQISERLTGLASP